MSAPAYAYHQPPGPPPTDKTRDDMIGARTHGTPSSGNGTADGYSVNESITQRREQLRRMQERLNSPAFNPGSHTGGDGKSNLLAFARTQLHQPLNASRSTPSARLYPSSDSVSSDSTASSVSNARPPSRARTLPSPAYGAIHENQIPAYASNANTPILQQSYQYGTPRYSSDDESLLLTPPMAVPPPRPIPSGSASSASSVSSRSTFQTPSVQSRPPPPKPMIAPSSRANNDTTPISAARGLTQGIQKYLAEDSDSVPPPPRQQPVPTSPPTPSSITIKTTPDPTPNSITIKAPRSSTTGESNLLRLTKKLREVTEEKTTALRQVSNLEAKLQSSLQKAQNSTEIQRAQRIGSLKILLQATERKVTRNRLRKAFSNWKSLSPPPTPYLTDVPLDLGCGLLNQGQDASSISRESLSSNNRRFFNTPQPKYKSTMKRHLLGSIPEKALAEAAEIVASEYSSDIATYYIREPFQSASSSPDNMWKDFGILPHSEYVDAASPKCPDSIEIMAIIQADESVLVTHDKCAIKHGTVEEMISGECMKVDDVEEDGGLRCVSYIDGDGVEREYLLDTIYREAMQTRHAYCASLLTAASTLQLASERNKAATLIIEKHNVVDPVISQTMDMCVGTTDIIPSTIQEEKKEEATEILSPPAPEKKIIPEEKETHIAEEREIPIVEEKEKSGVGVDDLLSSLIAAVFSFSLHLIYTMFFKLPGKCFRSFSKIAIFVTIVAGLWFFIADDHGAMDMGAGVDYGWPVHVW